MWLAAVAIKTCSMSNVQELLTTIVELAGTGFMHLAAVVGVIGMLAMIVSSLFCGAIELNDSVAS